MVAEAVLQSLSGDITTFMVSASVGGRKVWPGLGRVEDVGWLVTLGLEVDTVVTTDGVAPAPAEVGVEVGVGVGATVVEEVGADVSVLETTDLTLVWAIEAVSSPELPQAPIAKASTPAPAAPR